MFHFEGRFNAHVLNLMILFLTYWMKNEDHGKETMQKTVTWEGKLPSRYSCFIVKSSIAQLAPNSNFNHALI
jgi:hypothetical protein